MAPSTPSLPSLVTFAGVALLIFSYRYDESINLSLVVPFGLAWLSFFSMWLKTRLSFYSATRLLKTGAPASPPVLPSFIPYLGHLFSIVPSLGQFLRSQARANPKLSVFALNLVGTQHNVIVAPSVTHHVLTRNVPVNMHEMVLRVMETVWGDRKKIERSLGEDFLWKDSIKVVHGLMRESFVTTALSATVTGLQDRILNLVSGNDSPVDHSNWERSGKVALVSSPGSSPFTAEADLHALLREFVGYLATDILMGTDFNINYPSALPDLFLAESKFHLFMTGLPDWFPALRHSSLARNRLIEAVRQHHIAYLKYSKGDDPGSMWGNIDNTSTIMKERIISWEHSTELPDTAISWEQMTEEAGRADASLMWAMNANANQMVYWMVFYIYLNPGLLKEIRQEVSPFVSVKQPAGGLPMQVQPEVEINLEGLRKSCPLLQGTFLETLRLEGPFMSYKYVEEDFKVAESAEDARIFKHETPYTYRFRKGEFICIPGLVHQNDPRYWNHPETFDARRFWVSDDEVSSKLNSDPVAEADANHDLKAALTTNVKMSPTKEQKVDYRTMKVWGGGKEICKGKKFAEGEVLLFVASIVHFWEMSPVNMFGYETAWKHPGRVEGAGANKPKKNMRVKMWRRDLSAADEEQMEKARAG